MSPKIPVYGGGEGEASDRLKLFIGLLRATVFRHFLDFLALREASRHFRREV
jgi:hypothetical protein